MRAEIKCTRCEASVIVLDVKDRNDQAEQLKKNGWLSKPAICGNCR